VTHRAPLNVLLRGQIPIGGTLGQNQGAVTHLAEESPRIVRWAELDLAEMPRGGNLAIKLLERISRSDP
jgi:hypothetical protein